MSRHFEQSAIKRATLIAAYRSVVRWNFLRSGKKVFVNSIPKAGTHLLIAELTKFDEVQNSRLHFITRDIAEKGGKNPFSNDISAARLRAKIRSVRKGQMFTAHCLYSDTARDILAENDVRTIFVIRDPRDVIVSLYHYINGLQRHPLHDYITGLDRDEAKWEAIIAGRGDTPAILSLEGMLRGYAGWIDAAGVLAVRFEDLVGQRGGGSDEVKREKLLEVARHIEAEPSQVDAIVQSKLVETPTLRSGRASAWRETMPAHAVALVERLAGEQIARFGYEV